jgi:hypothetical protein
MKSLGGWRHSVHILAKSVLSLPAAHLIGTQVSGALYKKLKSAKREKTAKVPGLRITFAGLICVVRHR